MILDVEQELRKRHIFFKPVGTGRIQLCCPFHNEKTPSMVVSTNSYKGQDKGLFYCYGCLISGNFYNLLAQLDGVEISVILSEYNVTDFNLNNSINYFYTKLNYFSEEEKKYHKVSWKKYNQLKKPSGKYLDYLFSEKRKFNQESIDRFDLKMVDSGFYINRIAYPFIDLENKILTIKFRSILSDISKKYKVLQLEDTKPKPCLFGIKQLKEKFGEIKSVYLVEGESDAIYLQQNNKPALALSGLSISNSQLLELVNNFDFVIMALDGDVRNNEISAKAVEKTLKKIRKNIDADIINLPINKDPNDLLVEEIEVFFNKI